MKLSYELPENWNIINPDYYQKFSILSTEDSPCEVAFAIENEKSLFDVVSVYNYGEVGKEFLEALVAQLTDLDNDNKAVDGVNNYISEKAKNFSVTKTSSIKPLYYKKGTMGGQKVFLTIMKCVSNAGVGYAIQIFVNVEKFLYCLSASVPSIDASRPLESMLRIGFIKDIAEKIIPSLKLVK